MGLNKVILLVGILAIILAVAWVEAAPGELDVLAIKTGEKHVRYLTNILADFV